MEERGNPNDIVFDGMPSEHNTNITIAKWVKSAGIDKKITFHCAKHIELPLSLNLNRLQRLVS